MPRSIDATKRRLRIQHLEYAGRVYKLDKTVEWIDGIPHIECSYLKTLQPITEYRYRRSRTGAGVNIQQPSRIGCRQRDWDRGKRKPQEEKNKVIDGVLHRKCAELGIFLPIDKFLTTVRNGKTYYKGTSKEGKRIENNRNRASTRRAIKRWKKENRGKVNAAWKRRHSRRQGACPRWLTKEDLQKIENIYIESQRKTEETGIRHHVHHVYPLHGTNKANEHVSCGLHVPWNLAVVTAAENLRIGHKNPT